MSSLNPPSNSSTSDRVQRAFDDAIALTGVALSTFLTQLRAENSAAADEVESLLRYHAKSGGALDTPVDTRVTPSLVGQTVGGCKLERLIGAGGMSVVYSAVQGFPPRRVAVKIVRSERMGTSARRRLRVEAEALARLEHPNIARVYTAGSQEIAATGDDEESPYIVMELVEGAVTITRWADKQNLTARARIDLVATIADAVEHAHRAGVIHRDIKPGNVVVGSDGILKIIDFGIASVANSMVTAATEGVMGTLAYMSPEQARGDTIDTRSDVWGLGALLYDLLADRPPFDMRDTSLARHIDRLLHDPPIAIAHAANEARSVRFVEEIPPATDAVLHRALATDPERRYRSAGELADELRRLSRGEPLLARPDSEWDGVARLMRRHRRSLFTAGCIMLAVVGALIVSLILLKSEREALEREEWMTYVASISAASSLLERTDASEAKKHLAKSAPSLRGWEWKHLSVRCDQTAWQVELPEGNQVYGLDYSLDGTMLFAAASQFAVAIDTATHKEVWRMRTAGQPYWRAITTNDGGAIFVRNASAIERRDTAGALVAACEDSNVTDIAFDATRTRLFTNTVNGFIDRDTNSLEAKRTVRATPPLSEFPRALAASPDASRIVLGDKGGTTTCLDADTGNVQWTWKPKGPTVEVRGVAFSKDGTRVVTCGGRTLAVLHAQTGAILWEVNDPSRGFRYPRFMPDGSEVIAVTWQESVERYDALTGASKATIVGSYCPVWTAVPSPDGKWIASGNLDARVQVCDANASVQIPEVKLDGSAVLQLAPLLDDNAALAVTRDGGLFRVDAQPLHATKLECALHATTVRRDGDGTIALGHSTGFAFITKDGVILRNIETPASVDSLAFVDRGKMLAAHLTNGTERFYDARTDELLHTIENREFDAQPSCDTAREGFAFVPGGQGGSPLCIDLRTGITRPVAPSPEYAMTASLSPDRKTLALGCVQPDGEVTLLDANSLKIRAFLDGHRGIVRALAWTQDGKLLASAGSDAWVRVWDVKRKVEIIAAWKGACFDVAFDNDDTLWLACLDGKVRLLRSK